MRRQIKLVTEKGDFTFKTKHFKYVDNTFCKIVTVFYNYNYKRSYHYDSFV